MGKTIRKGLSIIMLDLILALIIAVIVISIKFLNIRSFDEECIVRKAEAANILLDLSENGTLLRYIWGYNNLSFHQTPGSNGRIEVIIGNQSIGKVGVVYGEFSYVFHAYNRIKVIVRCGP